MRESVARKHVRNAVPLRASTVMGYAFREALAARLIVCLHGAKRADSPLEQEVYDRVQANVGTLKNIGWRVKRGKRSKQRAVPGLQSKGRRHSRR